MSAEWAKEILVKHPELNAENVVEILRAEIGILFTKVLEHAGFYPCTAEGRAAFLRFIDSL